MAFFAGNQVTLNITSLPWPPISANLQNSLHTTRHRRAIDLDTTARPCRFTPRCRPDPPSESLGYRRGEHYADSRCSQSYDAGGGGGGAGRCFAANGARSFDARKRSCSAANFLGLSCPASVFVVLLKILPVTPSMTRS